MACKTTLGPAACERGRGWAVALTAVLLSLLLPLTGGHAQRPDIPPQAIVAPLLDYAWEEGEETLALPAGLELGQVASVAVAANGNLIVMHRGAMPLLEFDADGNFLRGFGDGLFERAHSITIAPDGTYWVTDVSLHVVMHLNANGQVLLTLGEPGEAGQWDEAAGIRRFDQPTDVAIGSNGDVFVTQGHSRADPRVYKFDAQGNFISAWGTRGTHPWEFVVAHSVTIGADGLLYIGDRENRRIQIYSQDGEFVRGWVYRGMACSLTWGEDGYLYMTTGFDGQIVKLDSEGEVIGVIGEPGDGAGGFGEAHDLAVTAAGRIYITDVIHRRIVSYRPR